MSNLLITSVDELPHSVRPVEDLFHLHLAIRVQIESVEPFVQTRYHL